jgi:ABC-2 type transport system permease protein
VSPMRRSLLRIGRMVRKELRQLFRDPRTKRVIFVSPVIQLLLFGYAVNTDVRDLDTVVLDRDRTPESRQLVESLTASGYFRVAEWADSDRQVARALDHGDARVALSIPPGFASDLAAGRSPSVQVLVDGSSSNTATVAQGYAQRAISDFGLRQAGGTLASAGADLRVRSWFNPELASRVYNVPAVIGVIILLMSLLLTAMAVVREREVGTLDQLLVSPLSPGELILGKTLPVAAVAFVQVVLVAAVALLWFDIPFRGSVAALAVAALLFILAGLALGLLISTVSRTQQEAFLSMFLFLLPAIILSGFLYPVETMPAFFELLTLANPLRHFLEITRDLFLKGVGFRELWVQLTALAAMAGGGLGFAAWRFRRGLEG